MRLFAPVVASLLLITPCGVAQAQTADQCAASLSQTGHNNLLQINDVDVRAYYYKKLCDADLSSLGVNASNVVTELLSQATSLFGLNYNSQKQYCEEEEKYVGNHSCSYIRTSIVVEKALDNWTESGDRSSNVMTRSRPNDNRTS